jgi:hypothetical protein
MRTWISFAAHRLANVCADIAARMQISPSDTAGTMSDDPAVAHPMPSAATPRELDLGMWLYMLRQTLERSLALLAESRGLDWLSEFEDQLIKDIKGAVFEGVPIDTEVATIEGVIETLKLCFENARRRTIAK